MRLWHYGHVSRVKRAYRGELNRMYDYRFDHFDSRAEQAREIEESEDRATAFAAMSEDAQEALLEHERLVFRASRVTPMGAAKAWARVMGLQEAA